MYHIVSARKMVLFIMHSYIDAPPRVRHYLILNTTPLTKKKDFI